MRIVGTIQARMGSSRLPGKVMKVVCGKPLLEWHIERLKRAKLLDDVIVATTTNSLDDEIVNFCVKKRVKYYRGSENNVLGRIAGVIQEHKIDTHVEFFGDSPLSDPHIIDEMIGLYLKYQNKYHCVCNSLKTTYPPGQEAIVYNAKLLVYADETIDINDPLREHVSIHITNNNNLSVLNVEAPEYYYYPDIYLEVDTSKDFEFIDKLITHFYKHGQHHFSLAQIIDYLNSKPELISINQNEERRWKVFREAD